MRPLFEDAKASETDTRDVTRAHALLDHAERDGVQGFVTITGGKLTTFRLMAEDTMTAVSRHLGDERPCMTKTELLPGSEDGETYHLSERLGRKEKHLADEQMICECEMVPRSKLEQAMQRRATTNLDDIRRLLRLGMGPCQGGFCIYRAAGILHGLDGLTAEQADEALLHFLHERWKGVWPILYGDQLRQARLDDWIFQGVLDVEHLSARARAAGGGDGVVKGELHYDAVVIGAGTAGLVAGARLAQEGARVCVLAKGVGSTHLAPGTIDVLGYAPERVSSPAAAVEELAAARPDHPYALLGVDAIAEAVRWFRATVESGPLPGYRYIGELERNLLLPTAVGALRPSALVPETMAAGDAGSHERVCIVGRARCATSTLRCAPRTSGGQGSRRAQSISRSRSSARTRTRSGSRGSSTTPRGARGSRPGSRSQLQAARARRAAGDARDPRPARRVVRPPASPRAAPCSRSRRCRRRCRGCACTRSCARRCAAPAGGSCSAPRSSRSTATARA